jgi:hypothetical protein
MHPRDQRIVDALGVLETMLDDHFRNASDEEILSETPKDLAMDLIMRTALAKGLLIGVCS